MKLGYALGGGGLVAAIAGAIVAYRNAANTKKAVDDAVGGASPSTKAKIDAGDVRAAVAEAAPPAPSEVQAAAAATPPDVQAIKDSTWYKGQIKLRLTGYWPFTAASGEKKMEGGIFDRKMNDKYKNDPSSATYKAHVLHTIEDFFSGKSDHVSLSGDSSAWPYGQAVKFQWSDGRQVFGRVTDTGDHFRGKTKLYRSLGAEPIDVCVLSKLTKPPETVTAQIVVGDTLDKTGAAVAVSKFRGQDVTVGGRFDLIGALPFVDEPLVDCLARGREFARGHVVSSNGRERFWDLASGEYDA